MNGPSEPGRPPHLPLDPAFQQALSREGIHRARQFIKGVKLYRHHPARRPADAAPIIARRGSASLRDYNPGAQTPIVLMIPSLINSGAILDLMPGLSFAQTAAAHGLRPLIVDWGTPAAAENNFGIDAYITQILLPFLDQIADTGQPVHILGYCMGGLLALALACLRPTLARSLTLMATPWDFHAPDPAIGPLFHTLAQQLEPTLVQHNRLPVDTVQALFAAFQPLHGLKKFASFASFDQSAAEAERFVLLEDWLNDGPPLTAPVARDCLTGWYAGNLTGTGRWIIGNQPVDPSSLRLPAYISIPTRDHIVAPASAHALAALLPHATLRQPATGHIGLMASRRAPHMVWQDWLTWLSAVHHRN